MDALDSKKDVGICVCGFVVLLVSYNKIRLEEDEELRPTSRSCERFRSGDVCGFFLKLNELELELELELESEELNAVVVLVLLLVVVLVLLLVVVVVLVVVHRVLVVDENAALEWNPNDDVEENESIGVLGLLLELLELLETP